jgi:hypothetical protein
MDRWTKNRLLAFALVGILAATPALAVEGGVDPDTFNWGKAFDYTMCAIGVAGAATGAGVALALLACGKIAIKYWD